MVMVYIEEKPSFNDLADLRDEVKTALHLISSLAESKDVPQNACDLVTHIHQLNRKVINLLTVQEDD